MTDILVEVLAGGVMGAIFGPIGYGLGRSFWRRYRWRGFWIERRPPPPTPEPQPFPAGRLRIQAIPIACPLCGHGFSADIELERGAAIDRELGRFN